MLKRLVLSLMLGLLVIYSNSQDVSFIALGDIHYDRLDFHDWDYVLTRPQDFKQIMEEYPQNTAVYLPRFLNFIKTRSVQIQPSVKAVVQLGDLVEGVAGTETLAREMNRGAVDLLYSVGLNVPWVLVKGNHDVSNSPGQSEAWQEVIRPFIELQVNKSIGTGMYTYKLSDQVEFFVLDQFFSNDQNLPESEMVSFLEKEFERSTAKYKFVLTHQPVIPVTDRCWHLLSGIRRPVSDPSLRENFLDLLGKNKVIVLCAHLHKFSVLSRETKYGPVIQIMMNSVVNSFVPKDSVRINTQYRGQGFVDENPSFQPFNQETRKKILEYEKQHITSFLVADLPGYALLSIREKENDVILKYFNGFSVEPYYTLNLNELKK